MKKMFFGSVLVAVVFLLGCSGAQKTEHVFEAVRSVSIENQTIYITTINNRTIGADLPLASTMYPNDFLSVVTDPKKALYGTYVAATYHPRQEGMFTVHRAYYEGVTIYARTPEVAQAWRNQINSIIVKYYQPRDVIPPDANMLGDVP